MQANVGLPQINQTVAGGGRRDPESIRLEDVG